MNSSSKRGFALVLVISLVVLTTFLVTAYMSRSLQGLKMAKAQASHYRTDFLARSALQNITGDLIRELENGSTTETLSNGHLLYFPKNRTTQFPTKNLSTSQKSLLKISRVATPFSTSPELQSGEKYINTALASPSDEADIKGRKITRSQWDLTQFQSDTETPDQAPDWILVNRNGLIQPGNVANYKQLADAQSHNPDYVIGRYAFMIYDQGGLLNANEAGAPSSADADFKARRGAVAQLDLTTLPGMIGADKMVDWRNKKSLLNFASYKKTFFESKRACNQLELGNRTFLGRRDFLHYVDKFPEQIQKEGVKFLSTFHRSLDLPSLIPDQGRAKTSDENHARGLDDAINPSSFSVKDDRGNLIVKRRFPLIRIAHLEKGSDALLIEKFFGLKKAATAKTWIYNHGDSSKILRLSEVASLGREPDFFETLKAAIWIGSLGKSMRPSASHSSLGIDPYHESTDIQIIAIGLNIIDQWDQDSYPTRVIFDTDEVYGTENLPYLYRIHEEALRFGGLAGPEVRKWFCPELWNPHQSPGIRTEQGPTKVRFVGDGTGYIYVYNPAAPVLSAPKRIHDTDPGVSFNLSINNYCQEPTPLTKSNAIATGEDFASDASFQTVGLHIGTVTAPDPAGTQYGSCFIFFQTQIHFKLQYQIGSEWITYNQMDHADRIGAGSGGPFLTERRYDTILRYRGDPRTSRFGHTIGLYSGLIWGIPNFGPDLGGTIRPNKTDGSITWDPICNGYPMSSYPGWTFGSAWGWAASSFQWGTLSENKSTSSTHYKDPDNVLRTADGTYVNGSTDEGYPQITNNTNSRPLILNRPFRSVGEMGYAFRDLPWKHLDFFTENSADAALLDSFSIQETDDTPLLSSQIALNSPYEEIIATRLSGTAKKEREINQTISKTQAQNIAKKIISDLENTSVGPFQNRSELVTRLISKIDYGNNADNIIKAQRETAIRALSNDSDTRTWNLMIDLIAQTGCYTQNSRKLADFDVKGQTHYWMHLAIDRFTGKILDTQWEKIIN